MSPSTSRVSFNRTLGPLLPRGKGSTTAKREEVESEQRIDETLDPGVSIAPMWLLDLVAPKAHHASSARIAPSLREQLEAVPFW